MSIAGHDVRFVAAGSASAAFSLRFGIAITRHSRNHKPEKCTNLDSYQSNSVQEAQDLD